MGFCCDRARKPIPRLSDAAVRGKCSSTWSGIFRAAQFQIASKLMQISWRFGRFFLCVGLQSQNNTNNNKDFVQRKLTEDRYVLAPRGWPQDSGWKSMCPPWSRRIGWCPRTWCDGDARSRFAPSRRAKRPVKIWRAMCIRPPDTGEPVAVWILRPWKTGPTTRWAKWRAWMKGQRSSRCNPCRIFSGFLAARLGVCAAGSPWWPGLREQ